VTTLWPVQSMIQPSVFRVRAGSDYWDLTFEAGVTTALGHGTAEHDRARRKRRRPGHVVTAQSSIRASESALSGIIPNLLYEYNQAPRTSDLYTQNDSLRHQGTETLIQRASPAHGTGVRHAPLSGAPGLHGTRHHPSHQPREHTQVLDTSNQYGEFSVCTQLWPTCGPSASFFG
jgi:hypothetical protein